MVDQEESALAERRTIHAGKISIIGLVYDWNSTVGLLIGGPIGT